jgi:tetratricopeptide (TPR) repeat protein
LNHRDTLDSVQGLGVCLKNQNRYREAEAIFRRALRGREKVLGDDHRDTLDSVHWLCVCLQTQHRFKEAEAMLRRALQGQEQVLGDDHRDTLRSVQWLGVCLGSKGPRLCFGELSKDKSKC